MASTEPFVRLLKVTGDAAAEVLDAYKQYYVHVASSNYHQVVKDIIDLFKLVQQLETECNIGAFRTTSPRVKRNITEVLTECGRLAKLLRTQIENRNLRDEASTSREIQTYCAEITFFLRTYGSNKEEPDNDASRGEQYELERLSADLLFRTSNYFANSLFCLGHGFEDAQTEIFRLRSIVDGHAYRPGDDLREGLLAECSCEARLLHIKRLHEEIACLGLRHPREHGLDSWDELKGELPHMLDHIRGINKQLKWLEDVESPVSPNNSRSSTLHQQNHFESQSFRDNSSSKDARRRVPSPTGSNISVSRDSVSAGNKSRKARSKPTGYFSNQGAYRIFRE